MIETQSQKASGCPMFVARFPTALPEGPAFGDMHKTEWHSFTALLEKRREGAKDGANIVLARFTPEPDGRVRRLKSKLLARTAIGLDCETNKKTGEIPPPINEAGQRVGARGWSAALYTSHNHTDAAPRYRIIIPIDSEIPTDLPAVEVVAEALGLGGVLDKSKLGAASVFYLPSAEPGCLGNHAIINVEGDPLSGTWLQDRAGEVLAAREQAQAQQRAQAMAAAEVRRTARQAAGFEASENLIEPIRSRLDLEGELLRRGYEKKGDRFLYPGSETGIPGVHIMVGGDGVERVYSHHANDPIAPGNLPSWCTVKAIDVVDLVTILDYAGDRKAALHKLAKRFGIDSTPRPASERVPPNWDDIPPPDCEPECNDNGSPELTVSRRAPEESDTAWAEPVDFFATDTHGAPILKPHHIPDALAPFAFDTASRMGVDPTAVALAALVSCASVISDEWAVQPKRLDSTWTENARIWGAIVGDPSILKTPVLSAATKPIDKLEAEARKRHAEAMREWRAAEAQAKLDKAVPPPQPKLDRYMVEGTTPEALSEVLRDDDEAKMRAPAGKVLSRHDEMSEFFGGLDRYKAGGKGGSERGAYLRLYNGGRYTIDRIGRGSFAVPNWSACFLGGVQPGPIQRIARDAAEDGLLQRFIYCVPERQQHGLDREPDHAAVTRYGALFPALAGFQPARAIGSDHIAPLVFHADAHGHREDIDSLAQALSAMPDTSPRLRASFGKWPGLFARLCLTFHLIDNADHRARGEAPPPVQVIGDATARRVAGFMREIVLPHLMRAEATMFSTDQTGHARWLAGYILARGLERITARDIVRDYRALSAPEARREVDAVMLSLVSVGWLEPEAITHPTKGCTAWRVNPGVHTKFAARAAAESSRRAKARERIAEAVAKARSTGAAASF